MWMGAVIYTLILIVTANIHGSILDDKTCK